jgi:hypothetical protein
MFEEAKVLGQPVRNFHGEIQVAGDSPQTLRLRALSADMFGGTVGGEGLIEFGPHFQYELILKALGLQLEEFGKHNLASNADIEGAARVDLYLKGNGPEVADLKGNGAVDVPSGKLYRLPLLLDLLKALGLRMPDKTAFEQAHMKFEIDSSKLHIQKLDLLGNAVSLRGQGTVNLDGSNLNLDFSVDWGRIPDLMPPPLVALPQMLSDQILKIKLRGKIGDVRFEKELMPGVVEPIKKVLGKQ